jgi:Tol biopolymer transport system component
VAFDSRVSGAGEIFVVRVDGGIPRRIDTGIVNSSLPSWSKDGQWLYFAAGSEERTQLYKVPSAGGRAVALTGRGGYWPRESPDGRLVYYVGGERTNQLWSASVLGGGETAVSGFPELEPSVKTDWMVVPGGVYFVDGAGPRPGIAFFDLATRKTRRIVDIPGQPEPWDDALAVSPDGRSILFSQIDNVSGDIMLVENFR